MGGVISNVQSVATQLVSDLKSSYGGAQFAVARYLGDPSESGETFSSAYDPAGDSKWRQHLPRIGLNQWFLRQQW